jgi:arginase family enzyme
MELIAESRLMTSMEVVELNPVLDLADERGSSPSISWRARWAPGSCSGAA